MNSLDSRPRLPALGFPEKNTWMALSHTIVLPTLLVPLLSLCRGQSKRRDHGAGVLGRGLTAMHVRVTHVRALPLFIHRQFLLENLGGRGTQSPQITIVQPSSPVWLCGESSVDTPELT